MPYIEQKDRKLYDKEISDLIDKLVRYFGDAPEKIQHERAGHLNYIITTFLTSFFKRLHKKIYLAGELRYSDYNEIIGVLECCKLEFYRRKAAPYEDKKIISNGDV